MNVDALLQTETGLFLGLRGEYRGCRRYHHGAAVTDQTNILSVVPSVRVFGLSCFGIYPFASSAIPNRRAAKASSSRSSAHAWTAEQRRGIPVGVIRPRRLESKNTPLVSQSGWEFVDFETQVGVRDGVFIRLGPGSERRACRSVEGEGASTEIAAV
ncbi:hypothetical protein VUR80DRAFT_3215 [Thermomyces stellatus]